jgi:hypothetical protein
MNEKENIMYIWTVEFEEHYSFDKKGEYTDNGMSFTVSAKNADEAIEKAEKLANVGEKFEPEDGEDYFLEDIRLIKLERLNVLDA